MIMNNDRSEKRWAVLEATFDRELEEVISSILWQKGTLGIVTAAESSTAITYVAYFDNPFGNTPPELWLGQALRECGYSPSQLHNVLLSQMPDEDWLKKWKEGYQPFRVGSRFLITPSWTRDQIEIDANTVVIEIDPGMAFGTGTHETTQLCLEAIEQYWQGGRFLDVGTGTGILTIAAAKLHPQAFLAACDTDLEVIPIAKENFALNQVADLIDLANDSAAAWQKEKFSLIVANLTADVIIAIIDDLLACKAQDGCILFSGILDTQQAEIVEVLLSRNCRILEVRQKGEWIAIIAR